MMYLSAAAIALACVSAPSPAMLIGADRPSINQDRSAATVEQSGVPACNVQTRGFSMDIVHAGVSEVVVDVDFCAPVSLEGVSMIIFDTLVAEITSTSSVSQTFSFTVTLLSGGEPVGTLFPASGSQSGSVTSRRNFILRNNELTSLDAVDGIRLTSTVSNTNLSVRYRGAYADDSVRAHFARGEFDDSACHHLRTFDGGLPVTLNSPGATEWVEYVFDEPVPLANMHFIHPSRPGFSITGATGDSFDLEGQLLLDNDEYLQMENWSSPGSSSAPAESTVWARELRRSIDYPECLELADRSIVGWRWRVHKTGNGNLTITPSSNATMWFLSKPCNKPGDLNQDGVVDVSDLLMLLAAWGACPDPEHCPADLSGDCSVDVSDLLILLAAWG